MSNKAKIILEDKTIWHGVSFGANINIAGELVFNTGMTGYVEMLTDPSYFGQIILSTYPLVGNYGVGDSSNYESNQIHANALVLSHYDDNWFHDNSKMSLSNWLKKNHIPGIADIDTRGLTHHIRKKGSMLCKIIIDEKKLINWYNPNNHNLVDKISTKKEITLGDGNKTIIIVDCGIKASIINHLKKIGNYKIKIVPWDHDLSNLTCSGIVLSNGPGDPKKCTILIENIKKLFKKNIPILGICLGHQLISLAAGGNTYKLNYGHRSHNQPILNLKNNKCYITSQNHSYSVDFKSLDKNWEQLFININDNSCEGIIHKKLPILGVQFHPEASPGPEDTFFIFEKFKKMIEAYS